ncbi:hypothetical protein NCTGTJJY_CDS0159 [Serratia phage 92A1]|nr:hypothetical protein NCTGTJJY_CDS0159 [Serratia phage 92A1]
MFIVYSNQDFNMGDGGYQVNHAIVETKDQAKLLSEHLNQVNTCKNTVFDYEELNNIPTNLPDSVMKSPYYTTDFEQRLSDIIKARYQYWFQNKDRHGFSSDYVDYLVTKWYETRQVVESGAISAERMRYLIKTNIELHGVEL